MVGMLKIADFELGYLKETTIEDEKNNGGKK